MDEYASQQELIAKKALSKGISLSDIQAYFTASLLRIREEHPSQSTNWQLSQSELRVWKNFFPGDPFPKKRLELPELFTPSRSSPTMISNQPVLPKLSTPSSDLPPVASKTTLSKLSAPSATAAKTTLGLSPSSHSFSALLKPALLRSSASSPSSATTLKPALPELAAPSRSSPATSKPSRTELAAPSYPSLAASNQASRQFSASSHSSPTAAQPVVKIERDDRVEIDPRINTVNIDSRVKIDPVKSVNIDNRVKIEPLKEITNMRSSSYGNAHGPTADQDWIHDRYDGDDGQSLKKPVRGDDFYRPGTSARREKDSYRPNHGASLRGSENFGRLSPPALDKGLPAHPPNRPTAGLRNQIKDKSVERGISNDHLSRVYEEMIKEVKNKYSNKSSAWREWATFQGVWNRLIGDGGRHPFPGIEPDNRDVRERTHAARPEPVISKPDAAQAVMPKPVVLEPFVPPMYFQQESVMEALARERGIRHPFFTFLQKARDRARAEHGKCTSEIRHFYADRMTWMKFFPDKPFVGIEPKEGHAPNCKVKDFKGFSPPKGPASSMRLGCPTAPMAMNQGPQHQFVAGFSAPVGPRQRLIAQPATKHFTSLVLRPTQAAASSLTLLQPASITSTLPPTDLFTALNDIRKLENPAEPVKRNIVITSAGPVFCPNGKGVELWRSFTSDNPKLFASVGKGLDCALHYYAADSCHLLLWATPVEVGMDNGTALNRGTAFIQGWIKRCLTFGMVTPSFYWSEMQSTMNSIATKFKQPDECLDEYKQAIGASDFDCLIAEGAAKGEGQLRLVLDEVTNQVVTLKELLIRVQHRAQHRPTSGLGEKRKLGNEVSSDANKRPCM